jgi:sigma-B regulation protein RsbU (phosphoserine phosphatase)
MIDLENDSNLVLLERSLHLKQLQINRLLELTQAINYNIPTNDLYEIYKNILSWEMSIKKIMLYMVNEHNSISLVVSHGISKTLAQTDIYEELKTYPKTANIQNPTHPLLSEFDIIIPVNHKEFSIGYALLGGIADNEDVYDKVKFITTVTNITAVAVENKRLFRQKLEQERLKRDVELAEQVQRMLIPAKLPKNDQYAIDGIYLPHQRIGGDYYDFFKLDSENIAFCIADVSGKGIAAAILMSSFQATLRSLVYQPMPPHEFIQRLNHTMVDITKGEKFITFFIGRYNLKTRELNYINAGHNPPILLQNGELSRLDKGCTIIGGLDTIELLENGHQILEPNALLFMYTDGLTDLLNEQNNFFGDLELMKFINQNHPLDPQNFNAHLMNHLMEFKGNEDFPDDISYLTCRFY